MAETPEGVGNARIMLRRAWYAFATVGVFSLFVNLLVLVSPIYMMQVFDRVLLTRNIDTLIYLSVIAGFAVLILGVLEMLRSQVLARVARWWDETAREEVLASSLDLTLKSGQPVVFGIQDMQTVRGFLGSPAVLPLFDAPWVPIFIVVIALLHPYLGLLALGAAVVLFVLALINDVAARRALDGISEKQARLAGATQLAIRNADVVSAMGMSAAIDRRQSEQNEVIQRAVQKAADRGATITGFSKFLRIAVQIAVLGLGAWLVVDGQLTSGGMIAGSIVLGRALAPVEQAIGAWRSFIASKEAFGRLRQLVAAADRGDEVLDLPAPEGRLSLEQATYVPPGTMKPILNGISFELEPGTALALIGPSAAGKSTLCRMLVGSLHPSAGHVRLDGAEIHRWNRDDVGNHVGYLPQSIELFSGTVKENIARMGEVDDEAVVAAAELAGCHELILQLPAGYETEIGEAGAYLSGGQKQRIALARALYGDPQLVVLDEANSNLDHEGEVALLRAIAQTRDRGATVVVVTHKPSMLGPVDKIAVLKAGRLEQMGDRDSILREMSGKPRAVRTPDVAKAT